MRQTMGWLCKVTVVYRMAGIYQAGYLTSADQVILHWLGSKIHSWESQNSKLTLVLTLRFLGLSISDSILYSFLFVFLFLFVWVFFRLCLAACRILVPWPGIKPVSPALEVWSPNHWITREFPVVFLPKQRKGGVPAEWTMCLSQALVPHLGTSYWVPDSVRPGLLPGYLFPISPLYITTKIC